MSTSREASKKKSQVNDNELLNGIKKISKEEFMINIIDFKNSDQTKLINSPRSVLACKFEGIDPNELLYRPLEYYMKKKLLNEVVQLRYEGYEKRRKDLILIVTNKREEIITENHKKENRILNRSSSQQINRESSLSSTKRVKLSYEELIEKGKEREKFLLKKMLENESRKNDKYEAEMILRQMKMEKELLEEKKMQKKLKEEAEFKIKQDIDKMQEEKVSEKVERKLASENIKKLIEKKKIDEDFQKNQEKKRLEEMKVIEITRKMKAEKSLELQMDILRKQEEKVRSLKDREKQIELQVEKKKEEIEYYSRIKKAKFEEIKRKVEENVKSEEIRRFEDYLARRGQKELQEMKIAKKKEAALLRIKENGRLKNEKIEQIIEQSDRVLEDRKKIILQRQEIAMKRIEIQRQNNLIKKEVKKAEYVLKNELKQMNSVHKVKKEEFKNFLIQEKIAFSEERNAKFNANKEDMIKKRLENQTFSQFQRELVRETLRQMAVWNVVDVEVAEKIVANPKKTFIGASPSEIVRRKVVLNQSRTKTNLSLTSRGLRGNLTNHEVNNDKNMKRKNDFDLNFKSREESSPIKVNDSLITPDKSNLVNENREHNIKKTYELTALRSEKDVHPDLPEKKIEKVEEDEYSNKDFE